MADVLNRKTRELLRSVNTPDYPDVDWIANAAVAAAQTVADLQEGGASPSKIAAALERWRKSRNELDGAILQDQQARVNQQ